jgi:hypothetical protein
MVVADVIDNKYLRLYNSYLTSVIGLLINNESIVTVGLLVPQVLIVT